MLTALSTESLARAAALLAAGDVVAFPTETVYGLGADARVGRAVAKIYEIKQRPSFNPLIVHVKDRLKAEKIAVFNGRARAVADAFWPGPLTLILPLLPGAGIDPLVSAGLDTVALRVPAHPVAQDLLRMFGGPIAAPSANRSGRLSPTSAIHVEQSFGEDAPFILAAGSSMVGLESTILDLTQADPVILRPGGITPHDLAGILGAPPPVTHGVVQDGEAARSPGLLLKHYAPAVPLRLRAVDVQADEALLAFGPTRFMGVVGGGFADDLPDHMIRNLSKTSDLIEAAGNLFRMLYDLEESGAARIAVMDIPAVGIGMAINDRLIRAAA